MSPDRAARCRLHPSVAKACAAASPMPFEAPVINTDLPFSCRSTRFPSLQAVYTTDCVAYNFPVSTKLARGNAMRTRNGPSRSGATAAKKRAAGTTRTDRIRQAVEQAIVSGKLGPGTKLDENALAARHGASRTPVREALQHL